MEPKSVKELNNAELLELVCQLNSRSLMQLNNKEMHDAYVEARLELESRINPAKQENIKKAKILVVKYAGGILEFDKTYKVEQDGIFVNVIEELSTFHVDAAGIPKNVNMEAHVVSMHINRYEQMVLNSSIKEIEGSLLVARPKPVLLSAPDLQDLKDLLSGYIDYVVSEAYHEDNDFKTWIFERTVMTFYGNDIFEWINKQTKRS